MAGRPPMFPVRPPGGPGSWLELLGRLGGALHERHAMYHAPGWFRDYANRTMLIYFVGGPWDSRLAWCSPPGEIVVPLPGRLDMDAYRLAEAGAPIPPRSLDYVTYRPDFPLATGVPVFSCLWS